LASYKLELSKRAERVLVQIAQKQATLYQRLARTLDDLEHDPFQGKPLKGELKGCYSYRVGDYRILYRVYRDRLLVIVIDIGHRRDIYK